MSIKKKATFIFLLIVILLSIFFLKNNEDSELEKEQALEKLQSLGYITWVPLEEKSSKIEGVSINKDSAFKGLNIYNLDSKGLANLIDMGGNVLHNWSGDGRWHHVELDGEGNLFVASKTNFIMKLDWNSKVIWKLWGDYHHDIALAENGDIYAIKSEIKYTDYKNKKVPILNDYIVIISSDGKIKKKISLYDLVGYKIKEERLNQIFRYYYEDNDSNYYEYYWGKPLNYGQPSDVFHTNNIEIINQDIPGFANKGNLLMCFRHLNLIVVFDLNTEKIIWSWGEDYLKKPHNPSLTADNHILIFDNSGNFGYSRVVELEPLTKEIKWIYRADNPEDFYSDSRGSAQRLPNNNILITESNKGRVFEITKEGEIVWEFWGDKSDEKDKRRAIYRMVRVDSEFLKNFDNETFEKLQKEGYF